MCGRYATTRSRAELMQEFDVAGRFADPELPASFNVAPTQTSAVVLERPPRDDKTAAPVRQLRNLRWGSGAVLGEGPEDRVADDQRPRRDAG